jgi:hypothetical protein
LGDEVNALKLDANSQIFFASSFKVTRGDQSQYDVTSAMQTIQQLEIAEKSSITLMASTALAGIMLVLL